MFSQSWLHLVLLLSDFMSSLETSFDILSSAKLIKVNLNSKFLY